jgi:hypothetical protein
MALATELRVALSKMHAAQWKPEWPEPSLLVEKNVRLFPVASCGAERIHWQD